MYYARDVGISNGVRRVTEVTENWLGNVVNATRESMNCTPSGLVTRTAPPTCWANQSQVKLMQRPKRPVRESIERYLQFRFTRIKTDIVWKGWEQKTSALPRTNRSTAERKLTEDSEISSDLDPDLNPEPNQSVEFELALTWVSHQRSQLRSKP